jgi:HNH endonuclease
MTTKTTTIEDSEVQLLERFESKLKFSPRTSCWVWQAGTDSNGAGKFTLDGQKVIAHRLAYELYVNEIPDGYIVRQTCGNRLCCNPKHLELVHKPNHFNKLSTEQISQIHRLRLGGLTHREIAERVECSDSHVDRVLRGISRQLDAPTLDELLEPTPYLLAQFAS